MSKCIYENSECDYCGEENKEVRPSPFLADAGAMMCKSCWDDTAEEYANCEGAYIGKFEDGPGYEGFHVLTPKEVDEMAPQNTKDFETLLMHLRARHLVGALDRTISGITHGDINSVNELVEHLEKQLNCTTEGCK